MNIGTAAGSVVYPSTFITLPPHPMAPDYVWLGAYVTNLTQQTLFHWQQGLIIKSNQYACNEASLPVVLLQTQNHQGSNLMFL